MTLCPGLFVPEGEGAKILHLVYRRGVIRQKNRVFRIIFYTCLLPQFGAIPPFLHMPSWRAQGCTVPSEIVAYLRQRPKVAQAGSSNFLTPKA